MLLKAEGISKQFIRVSDKANVLNAVSRTDFELIPGALTVLEGQSGSGKTTLLNMLAGLLSPSEGKIFLDKTNIYSLDDKNLSRLRNRHFGIIPQGQTAVSTLTVLENVILPGTIYGSKSDVPEHADKLLEMMGISHLRRVFPKELSGGELRRVSIARALIMDPDILFADEPTSDLDGENTKLIFKILKGEAQRGKAVLVVTHEKDAEIYADRMFRMEHGDLREVRLS